MFCSGLRSPIISLPEDPIFFSWGALTVFLWNEESKVIKANYFKYPVLLWGNCNFFWFCCTVIIVVNFWIPNVLANSVRDAAYITWSRLNMKLQRWQDLYWFSVCIGMFILQQVNFLSVLPLWACRGRKSRIFEMQLFKFPRLIENLTLENKGGVKNVRQTRRQSANDETTHVATVRLQKTVKRQREW